MYIQIILLIIFICVCLTFTWKVRETFDFIPQSMSLCSNIIGKNRHQCQRCANAGYCTTSSGDTICVEGDWKGPINGQDCIMYEYGNSYANLSLIDSPQPYWADTHRRWNWEAPIRSHHDHPEPYSEGYKYFHHGNPPNEHHRRL